MTAALLKRFALEANALFRVERGVEEEEKSAPLYRKLLIDYPKLSRGQERARKWDTIVAFFGSSPNWGSFMNVPYFLAFLS
jgi:hypothetical protein